ncbi:hypothetical protein PF010_g19280 [Phytophthora fragariae]|uniref:Uncharacterized protein n=1 Tax=Phytophthora fragariae TaxID=53985 RepID=A0A6A3J9H5_9STRA|nr:hypothetical protein PF011_g18377 [Phytophthora fragariae]KAE9088715.1 hypothetical protein PF010_g19280 [Phytophthora fragariae]KAE9223345.1 hypothetical protein PF004_g12549 [Phytophthora fragariae]
MDSEAHKVRNADEDDLFTPANAFETDVGHFWGILDSRPYMRAKMELVRALSMMDSHPAIEAALAEAMDSLRLCRSDNVGVRFLVPTLMLLLGQCQEAYDFIKWHTMVYQDSHYDWGNVELPYLDTHDADMTEEEMPVAYGDVFFTSSLVYIKMTLAEAVKDAITAHELADRASLPAVVTDSLGAFLAPSGNTQSLADLNELHRKLTSQIQEVFALTHTQNEHFWGAMLDPAPLVQAPDPPYYSGGDVNQVKIWVEQNAMLWRDHHEFIREHHRALA